MTAGDQSFDSAFVILHSAFALIRIREILDPDLRRRIVQALAERRGCSPAAIPGWFELDDADMVDLLNDLRPDEADEIEAPPDPRE